MPAYLYPASLAIISLLVLGLERLFPAREKQTVFRKALGSDLIHLIFNGHFLGVIFYGLSSKYLLPYLDSWLGQQGWLEHLYFGQAAQWPLALQILFALFFIDLIHWCVHNLLHRVPFFWPMHQVHHSVKDGEMDWIVSFRFQWSEVVLYKVLQYFPLMYMGFAVEAIMVHAIFGTLIGHLNHANLRWDYGLLKYLLNSPKMHIWHHNYHADAKQVCNFGVIFSVWDWVFKTAYLPDQPPKNIGYPGVEECPENFFAQVLWPIGKKLPIIVSTFLGIVLVGVAYWLGTGL